VGGAGLVPIMVTCPEGNRRDASRQ
jgi:hypothetical protein